MLLSHHHGDHFDRIAARDLDHDLPIITEPHAARKLRRQGFRSPVALSNWDSRTVSRGSAEVRVTSLPGQHAPRPFGYLVPPVMGSLLDFSQGGQRLLTALHYRVTRSCMTASTRSPSGSVTSTCA